MKNDDDYRDIVCIVDQLKHLNFKRYALIEPYIPSIIKTINNGSFDEDILGSYEPNEVLSLMGHIFFGLSLVTHNISTISPPKVCKLNKELKLATWLKNLKPLGIESKQGVVYEAKFMGRYDVVLKKPKQSYFLENTIKDYFNGIYCVNELRSQCASFVYTYSLITMDEAKDELWLVTEKVNGPTLKSLLKAGMVDLRSFLHIYCKVLLALEIGQSSSYRFCHYDLHTENILISTIAEPQHYNVFMHEIVVGHKLNPVLIDYGMSSIHVEQQNRFIGQHNIEANAIYPYIMAGYDAYVFLLFVKDIVVAHPYKNNKVIENLIYELLKFYGSLDHTNYVDAIKIHIGQYTPLDMFKYVMGQYKHILNISIKKRTVYSSSIIHTSPIAMLGRLYNDKLSYMVECCKDQSFIDLTVDLKQAQHNDMNEMNHIKFQYNELNDMVQRDLNIMNKVWAIDNLNEYDHTNMEMLCFTVNLMFMVQQLGLDTFKPYRLWLKKFRASEHLKYYMNHYATYTRRDRLVKVKP